MLRDLDVGIFCQIQEALILEEKLYPALLLRLDVVTKIDEIAKHRWE